MALHPEWVRHVRGQDCGTFRAILESYVDRSAPHSILEVGGGDGYIASLLIEAGYAVRCTDPAPREPLCCRVEKMQAARLPFDDQAFDVLFTSNVIEHIPDLTASFREMRRVLKPGGIMIHSVPTPACSALTTLSAPPAYLRGAWYLLRGRLFAPGDSSRPPPLPGRLAGWFDGRPRARALLHRCLVVLYHLNPARLVRFGQGHGVAKGPIDELRLWRDVRWRGVFEENGLSVVEVRAGRMFYSMNKLLPWRFMRLRVRLAECGFETDRFYVLRIVAGSAMPGRPTAPGTAQPA